MEELFLILVAQQAPHVQGVGVLLQFVVMVFELVLNNVMGMPVFVRSSVLLVWVAVVVLRFAAMESVRVQKRAKVPMPALVQLQALPVQVVCACLLVAETEFAQELNNVMGMRVFARSQVLPVLVAVALLRFAETEFAQERSSVTEMRVFARSQVLPVLVVPVSLHPFVEMEE